MMPNLSHFETDGINIPEGFEMARFIRGEQYEETYVFPCNSSLFIEAGEDYNELRSIIKSLRRAGIKCRPGYSGFNGLAVEVIGTSEYHRRAENICVNYHDAM